VIRHLIADDLTGAADASVAFAARREVVILLPGAARQEASLTVIDTESRGLPPAEAAAAVTRACLGLGGGVFKKVDSTLRGPVLAELEAARVALGLAAVVLAPSLPAQGRIVRDGRLLVDGRDQGAVTELIGATPGLRVVDAATDSDLDRIAASCAADPGLLPAGSAGLAAAFARLEGPPLSPPPLPRVTAVLVAVASRQPVSQAQAAALLTAGPPAVELRQAAAATLGAWVAERMPGLSGQVAVLATGGDAAIAVCRALGLDRLRPRRELLPGLVLSETDRPTLWLATKAGGFGGQGLLLDAALMLLFDG
jgi:uncharacterized protein YgbK (DUF1537 family)